MKTLLTLVLVMVSYGAVAQKTIAVKAGAGWSGQPYFTDGGDIFGLTFFETHTTSGPFFLEAVYGKKRFNVCFAVAWQQTSVTGTELTFTQSSNMPYKMRTTGNFTMLAGGYYVFSQHKHHNFYTGLAIGPSFANVYDEVNKTTTNHLHFGYQATFTGFSYQKNAAGCFIEAGCGYKGILCAGLQFTLDRKL